MTSIPSSLARATSSTAVMPQSTVMIKRRAALRQPPHVGLAQAVAVGEPVGDQPVALGAKLTQRRDEDRGGTDTVDVKIAVDGDPPPAADRAEHLLDDRAHRLEVARLVRLVGGEEKARLLRRAVAAPHQRDRHRLAQPQLGGEPARLLVGIGLCPVCVESLGHPTRLGSGGDRTRRQIPAKCSKFPTQQGWSSTRFAGQSTARSARMPIAQTTLRPIETPGIAISAVAMSVLPRPRPLIDLDDAAEGHRADHRAEEGADDALPEAIGEEDGEVPEGDPHREPDQQCHQMTAFIAACDWGCVWSSRSRAQGAALGGAKGKSEDAEMRGATGAIQACAGVEVVI